MQNFYLQVKSAKKKTKCNEYFIFFLISDVTMLEIKKPDQFTYKSGQWVRISINELNSYKYHPFTLTSSPNEKNLTLHIRSVGPWTNQLRRICEEAKINNLSLPMVIYLIVTVKFLTHICRFI